MAKRLGAEKPSSSSASTRRRWKRIVRAMEAFARREGQWLSTVKQFGENEIVVEQMEMLPDGAGCDGTGQFQTLKTDSLVLAVGQHADVEFLKKVPDIRIGRGNIVEVDARMRASDGIFAGGDMIGGARTMTAAVGHGKKAARNIDAWLRGGVYEKPPEHPPVPYELLNLTVFLDADRREHAGAASGETHDSTKSCPASRSAKRATTTVLSCGNCFECDNCYAACPEQAIVKLGKAGSIESSSTSAPGAPRASNSARVMPSTWCPSRGPGIGRAHRSRESARPLHGPGVVLDVLKE